MIYELEPAEFRRVDHLFRECKQYLPVLAVIEGNFPGRVFADNRDRPRTALVWAVSRWAYIDGDAENYEFIRSLANLVRQVIIPNSLLIRMNWFELYTRNSPDWMQKLQSYLGDFDLNRHFESVFIWDKHKYKTFRSDYSFPAELVLKKAEVPILSVSARDAPFILEDFKTRTAIGFRLTTRDAVVAECRSNGFTCGNEFMIDVNTFAKGHRGKGYATAAAVALLDYCHKNGLAPLWETTEDNIASRRLAQKLGFVEHETYPVYAIEF